jgi:hypothetical protein
MLEFKVLQSLCYFWDRRCRKILVEVSKMNFQWKEILKEEEEKGVGERKEKPLGREKIINNDF